MSTKEQQLHVSSVLQERLIESLFVRGGQRRVFRARNGLELLHPQHDPQLIAIADARRQRQRPPGGLLRAGSGADTAERVAHSQVGHREVRIEPPRLVEGSSSVDPDVRMQV